MKDKNEKRFRKFMIKIGAIWLACIAPCVTLAVVTDRWWAWVLYGGSLLSIKPIGAWELRRTRKFAPGTLLDFRFSNMSHVIGTEPSSPDMMWTRVRYLDRTTASHHRLQVVHDPVDTWPVGYVLTCDDDDYLIPVERA